MKQKFLIFLALFFLVVLLVALNAASYVQKEIEPDNEFYPNRSTYHPGSTGTRAFYDLLAETGRKPVRWQEKPFALLSDSKNKPQTFVIIGDLRREFTDEEVEQVLRWVSLGGKLVVIDRISRADLISTTANWQILAVPSNVSVYEIDSANQQQMTEKTIAGKPLQPTVFTQGVNAVQPSRFASSIKLESFPADKTTKINGISSQATPEYDDDYYDEDSETPQTLPQKANEARSGQASDSSNNKNDNLFITPTPQTPVVVTATPAPKVKTVALSAPVLHVANNEKTLLADFPYGSGQIVFLTDPYIVSNAGIGLVDNAQLAINVVASREGTIAFDEYHQGFGGNENQLLAYFSGTPIPAIFAQIALLIGVVLFTQSRRFARPLPANEPNRLSKLEYVSAMAELQQRTKAYDLAIENIYLEFRRRVAKSFGVDNFLALRKDLASMIAERTKFKLDEIESLMEKCENIIHGEPTNKKEVLEITSRLREIEENLGLKRTRKQAFRK